MPNTTWNPADKTSNIALSGVNLVATVTSNAGAGVRSTDAQSTGKYYWEYTGTTFFGFTVLVGICNASAALSTVGGTSINAAGVIGGGGVIFVNGSNIVSLGGMSDGDKVCVALDLGTKNIWFRRNAAGNWNASGTANPATNVGGISVSAIAGSPLYGLMAVSTGLSGVVVTANFGDAAFTGTVPSGFTAGFPVGGGAAAGAQARAMVMA